MKRGGRSGYSSIDWHLDLPETHPLAPVVNVGIYLETALYRRQPRSEAITTARELMTKFGVALRADHKPGQVSGGQAQRIALCRALLAAPRVVLADEPTGNLDGTTGETVITALRQHAATGACVVVATHDPAVVAVCDRHLTLRTAS